MKTVKIGRRVLEIYDSIDELPIKRFHKFNKFMLVDAGVGSDLASINMHISKIAGYIERADKENAKKQLENFRQALYMVSQETNIKHLSFMVLIKSIDGKEVHDLSDENMKRLLEIFKNEPASYLDKLLQFVKKKIDQELSLFFPGQFDDAAVKEYFDKIKHRTLAQLDEIIRGSDNSAKIDEIDGFLLNLVKPKMFAGKESAEIKYEKQFEEMCLFLKKEISVDPNDMTVLQFYNAFEFIKKNKPKQTKNGRKSNKVQ